MSTDSTHSRANRFHAGLPATCFIGDRLHDCSAHDLSRSGVLLVGALPSPDREALDLTLKSAVGDVSVEVRGRVVRVETGEQPGQIRIGVAFDALSDEAKDGIEVLVSRLLEARPPGPLEGLKADASILEIRKALEAVPIAQRIALAARAGPREREILRHDVLPPVIETLVRNPGLKPAEAQALLASQFIGPAALDALAQDPRWEGHEEIRLAIACHPRVTVVTGERILSQLPSTALRKLLKRPGVNAQLRDKIVRKLARS